MCLPEHPEPCGHARHRTGRRTHGVVHELRPERHLEVHELWVVPLRAEAGDGAEAVEVARVPGRAVVVDGVPTPEQTGHHGLCHARREHGRDCRVRRAAAVGEDLDARLGRRRMPRRDTGLHGAIRGSVTQPTRATSVRGKSSRWLCRSPPAAPNTVPKRHRAG